MSEQRKPYVGPRSFEAEDKDYFYGRDREARELAARVISQRLLVFYAQSGAGKSSLINTKLIPLLRDADYAVLPVARVSGQWSGSDPAQVHEIVEGVNNIYAFNLMLSIYDGSELDEAQLPELLREYAELTLSDFLARLVTEDGQTYRYDRTVELPEQPRSDDDQIGSGVRYVLIIDQFEEILSTNRDRWQDREDFFRQLNQAMTRDPYLWVVLALREDYVAALERYAHLMPNRLRARFYMQRMKEKAAVEAVKKPARKAGRPFAPNVAEHLVQNLGEIEYKQPDGSVRTVSGEFIEPVQLQLVCYSLWESLPPGKKGIKDEDLQAIGDVDETLAGYYARSVTPIAEETGLLELTIRQWIEDQLISPGGIRYQVLKEPEGYTKGLDNRVLELLEEARLVKRVNRRGADWYELAHDRLVEPVRRDNVRWKEQRTADRINRLMRIAKGAVASALLMAILFAIITVALFVDSNRVRDIADSGVRVTKRAVVWPLLPKKFRFEVEEERPIVSITLDREVGNLAALLEMRKNDEGGDINDNGRPEDDSANPFDEPTRFEPGEYAIEVTGLRSTFGWFQLTIERGSLKELAELADGTRDRAAAADLCALALGEGSKFQDDQKKSACALAVRLNEGSNLVESFCAQLRRDNLSIDQCRSSPTGNETTDAFTLVPGQSRNDTITGDTPNRRWSFSGEAGQMAIISMEIASDGTTSGNLDPFLRLLSADFEVLAEDDDSGGEFNARILHRIEIENETLWVEASGLGDSFGEYVIELDLGTIKDLAEQIQDPALLARLCMYGAGIGVPESEFELACEQAARLAIQAEDRALSWEICSLQQRTPGLQQSVTEACDYIRSTALSIELDASEANLEPETSDYWVFEGQAGQSIVITMIRDTASELDPFLRIYNSEGQLLAEDDDSGGNLNALIEYSLPDNDAYLIEAGDVWGQSGNYTLQVTEGTIAEFIGNITDPRVAFDLCYSSQSDEVCGEAARLIDDLVDQTLDLQDPLALNDVCWRGSLVGFAEEVLPVCEQAVELAEETDDEFLYGIRDSRGLARALSGDYDGAIEDFQFFISMTSDDYMRDQRTEWIEGLEDGFFTMDDELREELRYQ